MREERQRQWRQNALSGDQQKNKRQWPKTEIQRNLIKQKKSFSLMCMVKHCYRLSREAGVSSLGDIQNLIEHVHSWSNCSHWPCFEKGVGWGALQMCIPASAILRFCGQLNYKHKSFECREGQWQLISHVGFISHQVLCLLTAAHTEFLTFFLYKIQPIPCKWWNLAIP